MILLTDPLNLSKRKRRSKIPLHEKLQLVEEAKKTSNRSTAKAHGIGEASLRNWRKQEDELRRALYRIDNPDPEYFSD